MKWPEALGFCCCSLFFFTLFILKNLFVRSAPVYRLSCISFYGQFMLRCIRMVQGRVWCDISRRFTFVFQFKPSTRSCFCSRSIESKHRLLQSIIGCCYFIMRTICFLCLWLNIFCLVSQAKVHPQSRSGITECSECLIKTERTCWIRENSLLTRSQNPVIAVCFRRTFFNVLMSFASVSNSNSKPLKEREKTVSKHVTHIKTSTEACESSAAVWFIYPLLIHMFTTVKTAPDVPARPSSLTLWT